MSSIGTACMKIELPVPCGNREHLAIVLQEDSVRGVQENTEAASGFDQTSADRVPDEPSGFVDVELLHDAGRLANFDLVNI
jgi:hypothetical protein